MIRKAFTVTLITLALLASGCSSTQKSAMTLNDDGVSYRHRGKGNRPYRVRGKTYYPMASSKGYREIGMASWYGHESGNRTASGEHFNPNALSAAHKTLPIPTKVRVTNLAIGNSVVLVVNDLGPFVPGRIIDLSRGAARRLNMERRVESLVLVEALN